MMNLPVRRVVVFGRHDPGLSLSEMVILNLAINHDAALWTTFNVLTTSYLAKSACSIPTAPVLSEGDNDGYVPMQKLTFRGNTNSSLSYFYFSLCKVLINVVTK